MYGSSNRDFSFQDTPDDIFKLRMVLRRLPALKEELEDVQVSDTNRERKELIINGLDTLEETISSVLKPVRTSQLPGTAPDHILAYRSSGYP